MRAKAILCALVGVMLIAVGCSKLTSRGKSDTDTVQAVMMKIYTDPNVPTKQIGIQANDGVVTLSGNVGSEQERTAAASDAAQVDGVRTVVNNLTVAPAAAQTQPQPMQQAMSQPQPAYEPAPAPKPRAAHVRNTRETAAAEPSYPEAAPSETPVRSTADMIPAAPAPPPPPRPIEVPAGTTLSIRMIDEIDTARNQEGDSFRATLDAPIMVDDKTVIPSDADVMGRVAALRSAGHFTGQSQLALELTKISFNGKTYSIVTDQYTKAGSSRGKNTAEKVGGGAAIGAIIGAIAGGGKGAAIGATVGAGAGGGVQAATKGQQIKVPSEAVLRFRLENPVTVTPSAKTARSNNQQLRTNDSGTSDYNDNPQQ